MNLDTKKILQFIFSLLVFANILSFNRTDAFDYKSLYIQIYFCLILILWVWGILNEKILISRGLANKLIAIFFLLNLFSFVVSPYKIASGLQFFQVIIYAGLYFIFLNAFTDLRDINRFINLAVFSILLVSAYAIAQHFKFDLVRLSNKEIFSTFTNPNFFAGILALNLPFCFGKLFTSRGCIKKFLFVLVFAIVFLALVFSESKGGIITGWLGIFIFLSLSLLASLQTQLYKIRQKWGVHFLVVAALIIFGLLSLYVGNFIGNIRGGAILASFKERAVIWRVALRMIKEHPLMGRGIGTFVLFFPYYKQPFFYPEQLIRHACNEFLELWQELGLFGLLSFVGILAYASISLFGLVFSRDKDRNIRIIGMACLSSLWSGIFLNLGDINLRILYLGIYFWLNLAISSQLKIISAGKNEFYAAGAPRVKPVGPKLNTPLLGRRPAVPFTHPDDTSGWNSGNGIRFSPLVKKIGFVSFSLVALFLLKFALAPFSMYRLSLKEPTRGVRKEDSLVSSVKEERSVTTDEYFRIANGYVKTEAWSGAIEYFHKTLEISPEFLPAYNNLGNAYLMSGDPDKAIGYYQKALVINPYYIAANYNLGYAYFIKGRVLDAYQHFVFCLKLNPKDKDSFSMLYKKILF